jgi:ATP-dependent Clp protease ATP-binding subunit ClpB
MDSYKLTTRSQEALSAAVHGAGVAGHPHVEPLHLLVSLLEDPDGIPRRLLTATGADPAQIEARAKASLDRLPSASGATVEAPGLSRPAIAVVNAASALAATLGDEYVSTEHLLVGLAADGGPGVSDLLPAPDVLQEAFAKVRGSATRVTTPEPESTYQALEKYGVDLTEAARAM